MSNELARKTEQFPAFLMQEKELIEVLRSSLYPGAHDASIKLVVSYCKASNLDPMQKPVHIVPMWDSKSKSNRDVIMPGIGLYRTQAVRTGAYAGVSDAEYGPDITETLSGVTVTYPEWCRVTVMRLLPHGVMASFSATERFKENYAEKGGQERSKAPNAMWTKRPYAQLAKCAEAQALRKAFPEVGAQPIEDELQEKEINPQHHEQTSYINQQPEVILSDVLDSIRDAESVEELNEVAKEAAKLSAEDTKTARRAYTARKKELTAIEKEESIEDHEYVTNWLDMIKSARNQDEINDVLVLMPKATQKEFDEEIKQKSFELGL